MNNARPGEKFVERRSHLLVGYGIGVGEVDARVWPPRVIGRNPIEVAFAVRGETKAFAPPLRVQIESVFLAFKIERKKRFDPLRRILRLQRLLGIGSRTANFDSLGENGFVIAVKSDETFRQQRANSLLDLRCIGMY